MAQKASEFSEIEYSYLPYLVVALILTVVGLGLDFSPNIYYGIFLTACIFAFHEFIKHHLYIVINNTWNLSYDLDGTPHYQFTIITLDFLIAVPMFGLRDLATRYVVVFIFIFGSIIFYWKIGIRLVVTIRDKLRRISRKEPNLLTDNWEILTSLYIILAMFSIVYLHSIGVELYMFLDTTELYTHVDNLFVKLVLPPFVLTFVLVLLILSLIILLLASPIFIAFFFPILLILAPELFWGEKLAQMSKAMELWIALSWIICSIIIFSSEIQTFQSE